MLLVFLMKADESSLFFCYNLPMANGKEDLREKNKDSAPLPQKYDDWRVFQGREDADMLREKSLSWKSKKDWNEKYDRDSDD